MLKNAVDIFSALPQKQHVVDWVKTLQFRPKDQNVDQQTMLFECGILNNYIEGTERLLYKAHFVNLNDGTPLVNGRYQLNTGASAFQRATREKNKEEIELCRNPQSEFFKNMVVHKSERSIMLDGDIQDFRPWTSYTPTDLVSNTTVLSNIAVPENDNLGTPATYSTGQAATTNTTGAVVGSAGAAFTADMVGGVLSINGHYATIISFTDATHITVVPESLGANDVAGAYSISYMSAVNRVNSQFARASNLAIASEKNTSGAFWVEVPLKELFGSCRTEKMVPFVDLSYRFEKQSQWNNVITKQGVGAVDAKLVIDDAYLLVDTIKPRPEIQVPILEALRDNKQVPYRYKKFGYNEVDQTGSTANAVVDLGITGVRVVDLYIQPVLDSQLNTQTQFHLASGALPDWSSMVLFAGQSQFPRFRSYQGLNQNYENEYNDFRKSIDLMESEGGVFITKQRWNELYPIISFELDQRSDEEMLSLDQNLRLEITWATGVAIKYRIWYSYEVEDRYLVTDAISQKVSSYNL